MDYFKYNKGELFAEDVNVEKIAQMVGTPVYVYSKATILDHYEKIKNENLIGHIGRVGRTIYRR